MSEQVNRVNMQQEFRICPSCGYRDGFHSIFRKDDDTVKWLFICPSCHELFDLGFTIDQATGQKR